MTGLTYAELADLMAQFPTPVRRELRCHPDVARWLMLTLPDAAEPEFPFTGAIGAITGIPVTERADFEPGEWELREDGKVKASGHIDVPPWVTRPVEFDIEPPSFSVISRVWPYGSFPVNRPMTLLSSIC